MIRNRLHTAYYKMTLITGCLCHGWPVLDWCGFQTEEGQASLPRSDRLTPSLTHSSSLSPLSFRVEWGNLHRNRISVWQRSGERIQSWRISRNSDWGWLMLLLCEQACRCMIQWVSLISRLYCLHQPVKLSRAANHGSGEQKQEALFTHWSFFRL